MEIPIVGGARGIFEIFVPGLFSLPTSCLRSASVPEWEARSVSVSGNSLTKRS